MRAWALTTDDEVVFVQRTDDYRYLIGREVDGVVEVELTPDELEAAGVPAGAYPEGIDEAGHVWFEDFDSGCLFVWGGTTLTEVGCKLGAPELFAGGRVLVADPGFGLTLGHLTLASADGVAPVVQETDVVPGGAPDRGVTTLTAASLHPDGTVAFRYTADAEYVKGGNRSIMGVAVAPLDQAPVDRAWAGFGGEAVTQGRIPSNAGQGGNFDYYFRDPQLAPDGDLFVQWIDVDRVTGEVRSGTGMWSVAGPTAAFEQRMSFAEPLPGDSAGVGLHGQYYTTPGVVALLDQGVVVGAFARLDEDRAWAMSGVWRDAGAGLEAVLRAGDPAVDGRGRPVDGLTVAKVGNLVVADDGAFVVAVEVQGTEGGVAVEGDAAYRVYGVTAPPATRIREVTAVGAPLPGPNANSAVVRRIDLHSSEVQVPSTLSSGPVGFRGAALGQERSMQARGTPGTGRSVDGAGCGQVVLKLVGNVGSALMRVPLDPDCQP